ncbi:protein mono-ADP-ribosyltransferase PARP12-like [Rhincodon typus]|uniref:protein mono-ADP-ribosyltransferase PARP12-like n=1 Tax=Rhincodon typus TaxID=259920 RepID=UPI00202F2FE5|nr:protein mono-ADP-ribosyltransferase PARP12-like [Rhincodon typus]
MSLSKLHQKIVKILCSNNGSLLYQQLRTTISKSDAVSDMHLTMTLRGCQLFTIIPGTGGEISESELTLDSRIIATTAVRLCKDYSSKKCEDCDQLHLCRYFILGHCKYSEQSCCKEILKHRKALDDMHVTSADLENVYLANNNAEVSIGEFNETLSFKEMIQKDKFSESAHEVRRRPRFISKDDVERKVKSVQSRQGKASSCESKRVPDYWDKSALTSIGYTRTQLSPLSNEYKKIQSLFENSMKPGNIQKIDRIQNLGLWEIFQWQKEQIKKKNHADADERLLFHEVTDHSIIDAICYQNFDWGSFTQSGTSYGKGTYFAVKASNANFDLYSDSTANFKIMFLARVLVGKFIKGQPSYDRPPSQDVTSFKPYDSCVDCVDNPSLFVIFEKYHIYPEYVIQFSNKM